MYDLTMTSEYEHILENWEIVILYVKYREIYFYVKKIIKTCNFHGIFG